MLVREQFQVWFNRRDGWVLDGFHESFHEVSKRIDELWKEDGDIEYKVVRVMVVAT